MKILKLRKLIFKKAHTQEYPDLARPPSKGLEGKFKDLLLLAVPTNIGCLKLTACDSKLVSFFKVDLQNHESITNCLRSKIKEQIV
jgi:hypothetical protein